MIGRISVAAISIFIGACASSGPEAPAPAVTASSAEVDAVASDETSAPPADDLYDLNAPNVETTASIAPEDNSDEIVCRREIGTGTKFSRKVCRRRADVEARAGDDQEALRKMRKSGSQLEKGIAN